MANMESANTRRVKFSPYRVDEAQAEAGFKSMNAQQAQALREKDPPLSPWRVVGWQVVTGAVVALATWAVTQNKSQAMSAAWGALAVVLPAALFARGLMSRVALMNPGAAVFGFFLWEMVKIALTVAMMFAATKVVVPLDWPAMLVGLIVTMKVYWFALLVRPKGKLGK